MTRPMTLTDDTRHARSSPPVTTTTTTDDHRRPDDTTRRMKKKDEDGPSTSTERAEMPSGRNICVVVRRRRSPISVCHHVFSAQIHTCWTTTQPHGAGPMRSITPTDGTAGGDTSRRYHRYSPAVHIYRVGRRAFSFVHSLRCASVRCQIAADTVIARCILGR